MRVAGLNVIELTVSSLDQTELLGYAFPALKSGGLLRKQLTISELWYMRCKKIDDNMGVTQRIIPQLTSLHPQRATLSDDQDKVRKFARMFSDAGETYRMLVLQRLEMFTLLVQAISECAAYPDPRSST